MRFPDIQAFTVLRLGVLMTLLLGVLLTSCSSSDGAVPFTDPAGNSTIANAAALRSIQGNWATDCIPEMDLYMKRAIAVSDENVEFALAFFSDANCTQAATVGLLDGGHSVAAQAVTVPTGDVISTTIGDAAAVDIYFGDVTLDGQTAPTSIAAVYAPEVMYTIALVNGINLYLGDDSLTGYDGRTPATRPISLDFNVVYISTP